MHIQISIKGGPGSGNWGHRGIPGKVGGSSPRGAGMSPTSGKDWLQRYEKRAGKKHPSAEKKPKPVIAKPEPKPTTDTAKMANDYLNAAPGLTGPTWEDASVEDRAATKRNTVATLSKSSGASKITTNNIVHQWAKSSNDDDTRSLSLQEAVSEEFDSELSDWQMEKIVGMSITGGTGNPITTRKRERQVLRAMYNNTQRELAEAGFKPNDTITMYRGMEQEDKFGFSKGDTVGYSGNAMESWSTDKETAEFFSHAAGFYEDFGATMSMKVRVKDILSTPRTGFGCLTEAEFVIFGNSPTPKSVSIEDMIEPVEGYW